ncbi:hypothetical protein ACFS07_32815 [Undibacterium arcticum]
MKLIRNLIVACLFLAHSWAAAEISATALPGDTRLVVFTYDQHNSYQILSRPKSVTDIQFNAEEKGPCNRIG